MHDDDMTAGQAPTPDAAPAVQPDPAAETAELGAVDALKGAIARLESWHGLPSLRYDWMREELIAIAAELRSALADFEKEV